MTGLLTPGDRPDAWGTVGDLSRRVGRLEAVPDCCPEPCGEGFARRMVDLGDANNLLGWWRLGDAASPFLDSNPYLSHTSQLINVTGTPLMAQVAGCLSGDEDDGAVMFNAGTGTGDYLGTGATNQARFALTNTNFSISCFVKPSAPAGSNSYGIFGTSQGGAINNTGYGLWIDPTLNRVRFRRAFDGAGLVDLTATIVIDATCLFIVATYSTTAGAKLYVDGALAASDPTTFAATYAGTGIFIGRLTEGNTSIPGYLTGAADECAIWGAELSATDIATLYASGLPCGGSGEAGQVITSDGDGGTLWAIPTVAVDDPAGRYDTINMGPGIVGTDEGDDSVTVAVDVDDVTIEVASPIRVKDLGISEPKLGFTDITTANVSTTKHGLAPKLPNDATKYLDGTGAYTVPAGAAPIDATEVWMPLTSTVGGDDVLVFDADHSLIPTLVPF